jgi:hypothetical protein
MMITIQSWSAQRLSNHPVLLTFKNRASYI